MSLRFLGDDRQGEQAPEVSGLFTFRLSRAKGAKGGEAVKTITLKISDEVHGLLETLTRGEFATCETVEQVIEQLIDHAQQGVYRPGSWERGWIRQAFGHDFEEALMPGDPYGRPNCEGVFQRPKKGPVK